MTKEESTHDANRLRKQNQGPEAITLVKKIIGVDLPAFMLKLDFFKLYL